MDATDGFDWLLNVRSSVQPIFVPMESFDDALTSKIVQNVKKTLSQATSPVKGLLFTNPNNPFGQCYPIDVIKQLIRFCDAHQIHFISDEIYALSSFPSPDLPESTPFVSVLQLDIQDMGCNVSRVHMIWSISKDFGSSGLRMVR